MKSSSLLRLFFVACLVAMAAAGAHAATGISQCSPEFPLKNGWLGGDAAYSIPLQGREVWIFGDTLYGEKRMVTHGEPRMVHNSIGISRCDADGKFNVEYFIRKGANGEHLDFFAPRKPKTWYWALDGFEYKNELWVTLLCIRGVAKEVPDALGFETCGSDLARVSGINGEPGKWKVQVFPLVEEGAKAYPSATTVVDGKFAYLFALHEAGTRPLIATRIPLNKLNAPQANLQYLAKDGTWKKGVNPADAKAVMERGNTELTIRYHQPTRQWLAVMNAPDLFSDKLLLRTAPSITGPWSAGTEIYTLPDMQKSNPNYDKDTFCYAGKEHPEYRGADSIVVTYACNTMKVDRLAEDLSIYFPKAVRLTPAELKQGEEKPGK